MHRVLVRTKFLVFIMIREIKLANNLFILDLVAIAIALPNTNNVQKHAWILVRTKNVSFYQFNDDNYY